MPRLSLERAALISAAGVLMFLLAVTGYNRYYAQIVPEWTQVAYVTTQGELKNTSLPIKLPEAPLQVVVQLQLSLKEKHLSRFFFWQDDCLNSLYVISLPIALPQYPYCDYNRGLSLDLSSALHVGNNSISLTLQNRGGPGGLDIVPAGSDPLIRKARLLVIVAGLLIAALIVVSWGAVPIEEFARLHPSRRMKQVLEWIGLGIALSGAVSIRWLAFLYESIDLKDFVRPWLDFIVAHGRLASHEINFSNYAPLYLYLLSLFSPLTHWLPDIVVIKLISVLGDIILALGVIRVVRELHPQGSRAECAGIITLFLPTVWLNSSMWGQVDALYTSALVWSFYHLLRRQNFLCSACFGVALSFKLQALFLAPLFACGWALGANPLWPLLFSPIFFVASLLPAWLAGRPFMELLLVYGKQAGSYSELTKGAPTLYAWLPNHLYSLFYPMGMIFAVSILALVWAILARSKRLGAPPLLSLLALASVLITPFLLPKMHDRYFFPADLFALIVAFSIPRLFWLAILTQITSVASYSPFLLGQTLMHPHLIALIQLFNVAAVIYAVFRAVAAAPIASTAEEIVKDSQPEQAAAEAAKQESCETNQVNQKTTTSEDLP